MKLLATLLVGLASLITAIGSTPTVYPPPFVHHELTTNLTAISSLNKVLTNGANVMFTFTPSNITISAASGSASNAVSTVKTNGGSAGVGISTMDFIGQVIGANNGSGTVTLTIIPGVTNNATTTFRLYSRPAIQSMINPTYVGGNTNSFWQVGANASLPDYTIDMYSNGVFAKRFMFTPEGPFVSGGFGDSSSYPGSNVFTLPTIATNTRSRFAGNGAGLTNVPYAVTVTDIRTNLIPGSNITFSTNANRQITISGSASAGNGFPLTSNANANASGNNYGISNLGPVQATSFTATSTNAAGYLAVGNASGTPVITLNGTNATVTATRFIGAVSGTNIDNTSITSNKLDAATLAMFGTGSGGISVAQGTNVILQTNGAVVTINATATGGGGIATNAVAMDAGRGTNNTFVNPTNIGTFTVQAPAGVTVVSNYVEGVTALSTNLIGYGSISASNGFYGDGSHLTGVQAGASTNSISVATFTGSGLLNTTNALVITQSIDTNHIGVQSTNLVGTELPTVMLARRANLSSNPMEAVLGIDGTNAFTITSPQPGWLGAQPTNANLTAWAAQNPLTYTNGLGGGAQTNIAMAGVTNSDWLHPASSGASLTGITPGQVGAQPTNSNLTTLSVLNGNALTNLNAAKLVGGPITNALGSSVYASRADLKSNPMAAILGIDDTNAFTITSATPGLIGAQPTNANLTLWTAHSPATYTNGLQGALGFTPANQTTTINVAGTDGQITSSAAAQDLSANRTWTLSLNNPVTNSVSTGAATISGNGSGLTNVPGASITGTLTNTTTAAYFLPYTLTFTGVTNLLINPANGNYQAITLTTNAYIGLPPGTANMGNSVAVDLMCTNFSVTLWSSNVANFGQFTYTANTTNSTTLLFWKPYQSTNWTVKQLQ